MLLVLLAFCALLKKKKNFYGGFSFSTLRPDFNYSIKHQTHCTASAGDIYLTKGQQTNSVSHFV